MARLLIDNGADVNTKAQPDIIPLRTDQGKCRTPCLLTNFGDLHPAETPLYWAVRARNHEIAALLLAAGADVNARNMEGWPDIDSTALQLALQHNDDAMVDLLRRHGAKE